MQNNTSTKLEGRVVLITGAGQRIGAHTARLLHRHGARLALHYRQSQQLAEQLAAELNDIRHDSVFLLAGDLHETTALTALVEAARARWQRLDALINNASSFYPTPVGGVTETHWNDLMGSNLKAPFFLSQAAAPYLRAAQGCIINIVDIHADRPLKTYPVYSMAKAGLVMMTKALAGDLGPDIRVNGVAPGAILWPEQLDEAIRRRIVSRTFLKRQGSPDDIARAVLYLIADAPYVTGHILTVDGGRSLNS